MALENLKLPSYFMIRMKLNEACVVEDFKLSKHPLEVRLILKQPRYLTTLNRRYALFEAKVMLKSHVLDVF